MAGDTQRQLLNLIRDFATEKSQGERRIAGFKKRIEELRSALDLANTELYEAKFAKEIAEQELKGYEVELAMNGASIQAQEIRVSLIQEEISKVGSEVEALKAEMGANRDEFIKEMFSLNKIMRKNLAALASAFPEDISTKPSSYNGDKVEIKEAIPDIGFASKDIADMLEVTTSQTHSVEQQYQRTQDNPNKVQNELDDMERKALIESIVKKAKELQELTRYPSHYRANIAEAESLL
ncbi:Spindle assembly checkpoint component [Thalictrum thalictroides]|uniref:Spindle assembly checkpoint component n=1 Tax=Thalictrum thalictroides TaxID=46969 RepID=A0A7J6WDD7_THATH|nr:Spindle assembly checkpoint component [Thalictrum thalictroides]